MHHVAAQEGVVAAAIGDGTVAFCTASGTGLGREEHHSKRGVDHTAFLEKAAGRRLASVGNDMKLLLWSLPEHWWTVARQQQQQQPQAKGAVANGKGKKGKKGQKKTAKRAAEEEMFSVSEVRAESPPGDESGGSVELCEKPEVLMKISHQEKPNCLCSSGCDRVFIADTSCSITMYTFAPYAGFHTRCPPPPYSAPIYSSAIGCPSLQSRANLTLAI